MKIATDLEQSKKLVELGIDLSTADMYYFGINDYPNCPHKYHKLMIGKVDSDSIDDFGHIPAWSLSALLNYLRSIDFFPEIAADEISITAGITYIDWKDGAVIHDVKEHTEEDNDLIDVIVKLIIWMSENNFFNKYFFNK